MSKQTIAHLASKYGVSPRTIRDLHSLSLTWQGQTGEHAARTLRLYNAIVAKRCRGIDPLV